MRRAISLATAVVAFYAVPPSGSALDFSEEAPCEMTVRFETPTDWACRDAEGCTACTNRSEGPSDLWVHCEGDAAPPERRRIPPGAELSICGKGKQKT